MQQQQSPPQAKKKAFTQLADAKTMERIEARSTTFKLARRCFYEPKVNFDRLSPMMQTFLAKIGERIVKACESLVARYDGTVRNARAYFKQLGEKWVICDANSRNGTVVDGLELQAQIAHPLRSGSKIKLAKVIDLVFLTPEELFQRIN